MPIRKDYTKLLAPLQNLRRTTNLNSKLRMELLEYLETWSDASLENLVLLYTGKAKVSDADNIKDMKIKKLFGIVGKLREMRIHDDLEEIYDELASICYD